MHDTFLPTRGASPRRASLPAALVLAGTLGSGPAAAFQVNDRLEINGVLAGTGQCLEPDGGTDVQSACRGGLAFQPELFYNPTERDQFFVKLGFGAGDGLNDVSPFVLSPWAADMEADVKDINGRDRSYLLEAWYAHTFEIADDNSIQITAGIIDPAFYINENAYANDEFTQFMNETFVNSHTAILPAYDAGGVIVWKFRDLTFSAVGMNVGDNGAGDDYNWYAAEVDYHVETALGEGNYRVMYAGTNSAFADPDELRQEPLQGWALSFDQELGSIVGVFLRLGWQSEDAAVDYRAVYSGGFDFKGAAWGREADNIGIGYGYLEGGNAGLTRSNVFETYYRFAVNDYLALTADAQYMSDDYEGADTDPEDDIEDVSGWVLGVRAVVEF